MTALPLQHKIANTEQITYDIRVNEVRFDGAVQRSATGMKNYVKTRPVPYAPLTTSEKNTLENFVVERAGWQDIDYDGEVWVCKQFSASRVPNAPGRWTINMTLEQK